MHPDQYLRNAFYYQLLLMRAEHEQAHLSCHLQN